MVVFGHWLLNGRDRDIRLEKNSITFKECHKRAQNIHSPESLHDLVAFVFSYYVNMRVSTRVYDERAAHVFLKIDVFGKTEGFAWTPPLRSSFPIMASDYIYHHIQS